MNYQHRCDGMLTLECQSPIKQTWNKHNSSELTHQVARDLHAVLGIKGQTALVFLGAAFTSEQLLQPGFPIQQNLTRYASAAFQGESQVDQVLSVGASDDNMPAGLQPIPAEQQLYHLPFCLYTDDEQLATTFEQQLMHKGMVSPPTYELLCGQTGVVISHANYMTYLDLVAMMHNHFQQLGLSHLWEIIEMSLVNNEPKTAVSTDTGNHFYLIDHLLFTPSFSWSQWHQLKPESDPESYINWLMAQRLSIGAFSSHGLDVRPFKASQWPISSQKICLGSFEQSHIRDSWWFEDLPTQDTHPAAVVYHQHPQAGVVAISHQIEPQTVRVYYPIKPLGIKAIEAHLSNQTARKMATENSDWGHSASWIA